MIPHEGTGQLGLTLILRRIDETVPQSHSACGWLKHVLYDDVESLGCQVVNQTCILVCIPVGKGVCRQCLVTLGFFFLGLLLLMLVYLFYSSVVGLSIVFLYVKKMQRMAVHVWSRVSESLLETLGKLQPQDFLHQTIFQGLWHMAGRSCNYCSSQ